MLLRAAKTARRAQTRSSTHHRTMIDTVIINSILEGLLGGVEGRLAVDVALDADTRGTCMPEGKRVRPSPMVGGLRNAACGPCCTF